MIRFRPKRCWEAAQTLRGRGEVKKRTSPMLSRKPPLQVLPSFLGVLGLGLVSVPSVYHPRRLLILGKKEENRRRKRTATAVTAGAVGCISGSRRPKALYLVPLCDAHVCGAPHLCTCVSTQMPSFCPHPTSITRYAIFGPTPGRSRSPGCLRQRRQAQVSTAATQWVHIGC